MSADQKLSVNQSLKQVQKLIITQELKQALEILQLNTIELEEKIKMELDNNPFLEESDEQSNEKTDINTHQKEINSEDLNEIDRIGRAIEETYKNYQIESTFFPGKKSTDEDEEFLSPLDIATKEETLFEHLAWQLQMENFTEEELKAGIEIIGNLNNDGFLETPVEEIASKVGLSAEDVEKIRYRIMFMDPTGVAARDLGECLLVQLKFYGIGDEVEEKMVTDFLEYTLKKDYNQLSKLLCVPIDRIKQAYDNIEKLDPKPARNFSSELNQPVIPDLKVIEKEGELTVILLNERIPKIRINPRWKAYLEDAKRNPEVLEKLKQMYERAKGYANGIYQRNKSLMQVAKTIVDLQEDFLRKGPGFLKPMILKDVAEVTGLHESTVSRIVSNKWIDTPWGIYNLKEFFSTRIKSSSSEDLSSKSVMEKIRSLVENEDPTKPLSDSKIASILSNQGIQIARRTVAKYREIMKIPPSSIRKRMKL